MMRAGYDPKQEMFGPEGSHKGSCIFANVDMHEWSDEALLAHHWNARNDFARQTEIDRLRGALEWCVRCNGECLGDYPRQLAKAREALLNLTPDKGVGS